MHIFRWLQTGRRAALQVVAAAGVFLYLPAEFAFQTHPAQGWYGYFAWPEALRALLLQCGFMFALPGIAAVQEFATRGNGTPIPYDPPSELVTTGMYRYVANPMQLSCLLTMLLWAVLLRSLWLLSGPAICITYSMGIARWDEGIDLERRFGSAWVAYRAQVHNWAPRWRPYVSTMATLYIARGCEVCSGVRMFLEHRSPVGLDMVDAEEFSGGSMTRMHYVCDGETVEGVRAMGRADGAGCKWHGAA